MAPAQLPVDCDAYSLDMTAAIESGVGNWRDRAESEQQIPDDIGEAVALAVAEYEAWMRTAMPSLRNFGARVGVHDGGKSVLRRPFKLRGHWCVRYAGTARLTKPYRDENGLLNFVPDWSRQ